MDFVYLVLFLLLLYSLYRFVLQFYINKITDQSARVKAKAQINTFGAPIAFGLITLFVYLSNNKGFNVFAGAGLTLGILIRVLLSSRKFLVSCNTDNFTLEIKYLTTLMKQKTFSTAIAEISDTEFVQHKWFSDSPASINIKRGNDWIGFYFVDEKLVTTVEKEINAAYQRMGYETGNGTKVSSVQ
jgi:hypothetical protein